MPNKEKMNVKAEQQSSLVPMKMENIMGEFSSSTSYASEKVNLCAPSFMQNRMKLEVKTEPQSSLFPIKRENEKDLSCHYEIDDKNKCNKTEGCFILESIKKEHCGETDPLALNDTENEVANSAKSYDYKISHRKEESLLAKYIKVEDESINNEYQYCELNDTKQNINIKENIIEYPVLNSNDSGTSVYEEGIKHGRRNYFDRETTSVSDARNSYMSRKCTHLTCQENEKLLHDEKNTKCAHIEIKRYESRKSRETFTISNSLNTHTSSIKEKSKYQCDQCKKHFLQKVYLQKHIVTVHSGIKNYECPKCLKTFARSGSLNTHLSSIHEEVKYKCDQCKKSFNVLGYLWKHIKFVHMKIRKFECPKCNKTFATSGSLNTHLRAIHEGMKYKCEQCKKSFTHLRYLRDHIEFMHMKIRKYECQKCKKTFTASRSLNIHLRAIHEEIKYKCEQCKKTFNWIGNLQEHIKTVHTKIRIYKCQKCKKTFTKSYNLNRHLNNVHEVIKKV